MRGADRMDYEIVSFRLSAGSYMKVLASAGKPSFMDELVDNPKSRQRSVLIARTVERVNKNGLDWARSSHTLKTITADLSVFELRVPGKVIRVMTYVHEGRVPVYLFDFDGHQGKNGKLPPSLMKRAEALARIAFECMKRENEDER